MKHAWNDVQQSTSHEFYCNQVPLILIYLMSSVVFLMTLCDVLLINVDNMLEKFMFKKSTCHL